MVERRWPTCISFAMFGEEKSTSTFWGGSTGGLTPFWTMPAMESVRVAVDKVMLMNPFGAEDVALTMGFSGMALIMRSATSFGDTGPM